VRAGEARDALVACSRALWDRGLVTGSSGNVSARLDDGSVLITPTRKALGSLHRRDLVRIDATGNPLPGEDGLPSSEWRLHVGAYAARSEIAFVVHTHPTFCVVWAMKDALFPRETVAATESLGAMNLVPYYPFGTEELADATCAALAGGAPLALLARHGLVAVAAEIEDAYVQTDLAEECAKVAYFARQLRS